MSGGIRTPGPLLRRQLLYPTELQTHMERVMGIEPTRPAWKAGILPLNYTRILSVLSADLYIISANLLFVKLFFIFFGFFSNLYINTKKIGSMDRKIHISDIFFAFKVLIARKNYSTEDLYVLFYKLCSWIAS